MSEKGQVIEFKGFKGVRFAESPFSQFQIAVLGWYAQISRGASLPQYFPLVQSASPAGKRRAWSGHGFESRINTLQSTPIRSSPIRSISTELDIDVDINSKLRGSPLFANAAVARGDSERCLFHGPLTSCSATGEPFRRNMYNSAACFQSLGLLKREHILLIENPLSRRSFPTPG